MTSAMETAAIAGAWIEPAEAPHARRVQRPAHHLATTFEVSGTVRAATVRITARGLYEAFVNGQRVGGQELTPGFTAYRSRLQVHTFDVTELVRTGDNAMGALLSDGWWRGQHAGDRRTDSYGETTALLAELRVEVEDGPVELFGTGPGWRSTPSHVLAADLIAGEVHDLRRRVVGWADAATDRSAWDPVVVTDHPTDVLVAAEGPATRRVGELVPASIRRLSPRRHLVDFGQNSNGWVRLEALGPSGNVVTITHGEQVDGDGELVLEGISDNTATHDPPPPFQTDVVTSAGDGATFEPRHSTKGFRYAVVDGLADLDADDVTSVVVHSDLEQTGGFSCSDERLNRLHAACAWSFRTNACEVPTDCPQRERAGWTGDWQVFVATAARLYDVHDFSARWLRDLAADQWADGTVPNFVPDPHDFSLPENARWRSAQGSSGWGDAACHVPWEVYRAYGRADVLVAQLESMRRWVDWAAARAAAGRHGTRAAARPDPAPHERFIWDTGFHFGEWTEPDAGSDVLGTIMTMDHGPTATAFLYRSATELAQAATVVGDDRLSTRYRAFASDVRDAWRKEFLDDDGHVRPRRQANLVRAVAFGLVDGDERRRAVDDLVRLIREADTHLGTGFLATPFLLPVLADNGQLDVAYELLLQDTPPSWLHMIDAGATTIWEDWAGRASRNHYSKGAVASFLHGWVAGLQLVEPGYRRFRVRPRPGGGITRAATHHRSPFGPIELRWSLVERRGDIVVMVPEGTTAELVLPDGHAEELVPGSHERSWQHPA